MFQVWYYLQEMHPLRMRGATVLKNIIIIIRRRRRQDTHWEDMFAKHILDEVPVPRLYKEHSTFNIKKTTPWTKVLKRHSGT